MTNPPHLPPNRPVWRRFGITFVEGWHLWRWFWRLERRRGQTLPAALLFTALVSLLIGLLKQRGLLPSQALPALFWVCYLFSLFQALPKSFLDISAEAWRWLRLLVSPEGAAWGVVIHILSWATGLWGLWWGMSRSLWGYAPEAFTLMAAGSLGLCVGLSAFLTAMARASYATASVLALPLVLMPLLLTVLRQRALTEQALLFGVELLIALTLLPLLWEN